MIELNFDQVKEISDRLIEERGEDYVYENHDGGNDCFYVHRFDAEGKPVDQHEAEESIVSKVPGCHVGAVLIAAGVPIDWFTSRREGPSARTILNDLRREGILSVDTESDKYLGGFQLKQDNGETWGDSRRLALEWMS